jgi:tetratricopeptide (TPR) repeat protein/tRNA A-37 threonylcarbamoyl transferase component Bud32
MVGMTPDMALRLAERLLWGPDDDAAEPAPELMSGGTFGRYHLVRLIGLGGMGAVYEAEQDHPRRRVAIKVIRPELMSAEIARRFEHEARILGRLQHPGIAQIYEAGKVELAGAAGGATPYFAMEYVEGVPLTEFATGKSLGVRERLELFLRACEAVEHAHRMGVIHRDLKPGNILVDGEGRARILDFGVARATDADVRAATMHTEVGRLVGTLPYMSPEQVAGDADGLDTRSDVYSLGVVLYELLAEKPPYDVKRGAVHEAARVIAETEPAPLSTVSRAFRGDLETIVGKALAKERERRYQSVGEMAADVRRYLSDEPILAHPPSRGYHLTRFARRHRSAVAVGCIGIGVLLVSLAFLTWQTVVAIRARGEAVRAFEAEGRQKTLAETRAVEAQRQSELAQQAFELLQAMFRSPDPARDGRDIRVVEVLDRAARELAEGSVIDPDLRGRLHYMIGTTYLALGVYEESIGELSLALDDLRRAGGRDAATVAALIDLCGALNSAGKLPEAEETGRAAMALVDELGGMSQPDAVRAASAFASALRERGKHVEAESILRPVVTAIDSGLPVEERDAIGARATLASVLSAASKFAEAEELAQAALEQSRRSYGDTHAYTLSILNTLAGIVHARGRAQEAFALWKELAESREKVLGPSHPSTLRSKNNLAVAMLNFGDAVGAEPLLREVLREREQTLGMDNRDTLLTRSALSRCAFMLDRKQEAVALLRGVKEGQEGLLGSDHPDVLRTCANLALLLNETGEHHAAADLAGDAYARAQRVLGNGDVFTIGCGRALVDALRDDGRPQAAHDVAVPLIAAAKETLGVSHVKVANLQVALGRALADLGRSVEAEELFVGAIRTLQQTVGADYPDTKEAIGFLAVFLEQQGRSDEAAVWRGGNPTEGHSGR